MDAQTMKSDAAENGKRALCPHSQVPPGSGLVAACLKCGLPLGEAPSRFVGASPKRNGPYGGVDLYARTPKSRE